VIDCIEVVSLSVDYIGDDDSGDDRYNDEKRKILLMQVEGTVSWWKRSQFITSKRSHLIIPLSSGKGYTCRRTRGA
jgi:hypothetical protein